MPHPLDKIHERMVAIRKLSGLSQEAFAQKVGTSRSIISQVEIGKMKPSYEVLINTVKLFNTSYAYLLEGMAEPARALLAAEDAAPYGDATGELARLRREKTLLEEQVAQLKDLVDTQKALIKRLM